MVCVKSMFVQLPCLASYHHFSVVVRLFQSLKFTSSCQLATKPKKTSPQSPVEFGHQNLKRKCLFIQTNMVMQWQSLILSCTWAHWSQLQALLFRFAIWLKWLKFDSLHSNKSSWNHLQRSGKVTSSGWDLVHQERSVHLQVQYRPPNQYSHLVHLTYCTYSCLLHRQLLLKPVFERTLVYQTCGTCLIISTILIVFSLLCVCVCVYFSLSSVVTIFANKHKCLHVHVHVHCMYDFWLYNAGYIIVVILNSFKSMVIQFFK